MNGFSSAQMRKLVDKLDRRHVHCRDVDGRQIDYIEGWFALSEANAIFGFANWDREIVHFERLFERTRGETTTCAYLARVRVGVKAGDRTIIREGTGCATVSSKNAGDAHEQAIKAAETDATKRALATFGNRFGLCLYDKEKNGVSQKSSAPPLEILRPDRSVFTICQSPEGFCTGLRQVMETAADSAELSGWWESNLLTVEGLKAIAPMLQTSRGEHYSDILKRLFENRLSAFAKKLETESSPVDGAMPQLAPSRIAHGPRIDKSELTIRISRRLRDKHHLRYVGTLPCLICKATPSHAHHLRFAQPRGLSLKVSDEFVVPLCAIHHSELHAAGFEQAWWKKAGIEPLAIAQDLWRARGTHQTPLVPAKNHPSLQHEGIGHQHTTAANH